MRGGRVEDTSGMDCGDGNCQPLAGLGGFCVRWWVWAERRARSKDVSPTQPDVQGSCQVVSSGGSGASKASRPSASVVMARYDEWRAWRGRSNR